MSDTKPCAGGDLQRCPSWGSSNRGLSVRLGVQALVVSFLPQSQTCRGVSIRAATRNHIRLASPKLLAIGTAPDLTFSSSTTETHNNHKLSPWLRYRCRRSIGIPSCCKTPWIGDDFRIACRPWLTSLAATGSCFPLRWSWYSPPFSSPHQLDNPSIG